MMKRRFDFKILTFIWFLGSSSVLATAFMPSSIAHVTTAICMYAIAFYLLVTTGDIVIFHKKEGDKDG